MNYPLTLEELLAHERDQAARGNKRGLDQMVSTAKRGRTESPPQEADLERCPTPFVPGHLTHIATTQVIINTLSMNAYKEFHMADKKINGSSGEKVERPEFKVNTGTDVVPMPVEVAEALRKIGDDMRKHRPVAEGTIMRWTHIGSNNKGYLYAAVFCNGSWYTTGHSGRSPFAGFHTHQDFMALLGRHDVIGLEVASSWEAVL